MFLQRFLPPLTVKDSELEEALDILDDGFADALAAAGAVAGAVSPVALGGAGWRSDSGGLA